MPVFVFLVVLGTALLWLLLSGLYKPFGKLWRRLFYDAHKAMNDVDNHNENNTTKEKQN